MAHQRTVLLMVNERNVAMFAVKRLAAFGTYAHFRKTTAVHQYNRLVAFFEAVGERFAERGRHENAFLLAVLSHVDNLHVREFRLRGALLEA